MPRLLDLFCGAGGAAMGYHRAGFEVIGVDNKPQPHYPFEFHQADALTFPLEGFDAYHASPPCQAWSVMQNTNHMRKDHPELIVPTRELLKHTRKPFVIENVPGSPLIKPIILCGLSFGLRVLRHRLFESNVSMFKVPHVKHPRQAKVRGRMPDGYLDSLSYIGFTTGSSKRAFRDAMCCGWMTPDEGRQAIPPAYTEYIGKYLMQVLI